MAFVRSSTRLVNTTIVVLAIVVFGLVAYGAATRLAARYHSSGNEHPSTVAAVPDRPAGNHTEYSIRDIINAHLFGVPEKAPEHEVVNAPRTKLRLSLAGSISSNNPRFAIALIQVNAGDAVAYRVGDQIKSTDARVHAVENHRVLLDRNGKFESLVMEREKLFANAK